MAWAQIEVKPELHKMNGRTAGFCFKKKVRSDMDVSKIVVPPESSILIGFFPL